MYNYKLMFDQRDKFYN